jgi:hypothetical protein
LARLLSVVWRWRHKAPKVRFECKFFLFYAEVALGYFGTTWDILYAVEQAQKMIMCRRGIKVNPPTPGRILIHCCGHKHTRPTRPCCRHSKRRGCEGGGGGLKKKGRANSNITLNRTA